MTAAKKGKHGIEKEQLFLLASRMLVIFTNFS